jgi:glycosyltransferase involved in cell wall biosynthesis
MRRSVSVLICSHNPREDYLARALCALDAQTLAKAEWELLLIDNGSAPRLADSVDLSWHPLARHVREEEVGLTRARLRGIRDSSGELLIFIDDDNVPVSTYLESALRARRSYPHLGAFGAGKLEPEFEIPPPRSIGSRLPLLALRSVPTIQWSNNPGDFGSLPWGAGLCASREVAEAYQRLIDELGVTRVLGRRGKQLFAGEDELFAWASVRIGKGFGIFPELGITHLIPAERLREDYFVALIRGHAFSHGILNYLLSGHMPKRIGASEYVRLGLHGLRNGPFSFRCRLASMRGELHAARYIATHGLRPVPGVEPAGSAYGWSGST